MRRNRLLPFGALVITLPLLCAACALPREPVFVDIDAIRDASPPVALEVPAVSREPAVEVAVVKGLSGQSEGVLRALGAEREREARESIQENRALALRDLERALFRSYSRELERYRAMREAELAAAREALYAYAYAALSRVFQDHARARGPKLARLSVLVGFPLPLDRWPEARPEVFWSGMRLAEANTLREAVALLDEGYRSRAESILAEAAKDAAELRTRLEVEVAERQDAMIQQARQEAAKALATGADKLDVQLATASAALPALAPAAVPQIPSAPPVGSDPVWTEARAGFEYDPLEHDLKLWLDMHGYERVASRHNGREATREFIEWRRTRRPGR